MGVQVPEGSPTMRHILCVPVQICSGFAGWSIMGASHPFLSPGSVSAIPFQEGFKLAGGSYEYAKFAHCTVAIL